MIMMTYKIKEYTKIFFLPQCVLRMTISHCSTFLWVRRDAHIVYECNRVRVTHFKSESEQDNDSCVDGSFQRERWRKFHSTYHLPVRDNTVEDKITDSNRFNISINDKRRYEIIFERTHHQILLISHSFDSLR